MVEETELSMWTVTVSPSDYPGRITARRWAISKRGCQPTSEVVVHDDIAAARDALRHRGMQICIGRSPGDDPVILETWV